MQIFWTHMKRIARLKHHNGANALEKAIGSMLRNVRKVIPGTIRRRHGKLRRSLQNGDRTAKELRSVSRTRVERSSFTTHALAVIRSFLSCVDRHPFTFR